MSVMLMVAVVMLFALFFAVYNNMEMCSRNAVL